MLEYSVVIPIFNEEESVRELIFSLTQTLKSYKKPYEIVFIDDGSADRTLEILELERKEHKEIRIFSFRKNLGKSYALMLGFQKAQGRYIITLDADLQDDPTNIKNLIQKLTRGNYDMITGWRKVRRDSILKVASSRIFNNLVSFFFGIALHDLNSGLKVYKSEVAKDLKIYGGMHRFIPVIAHEMGYRVSEKEVVHHARKYGSSKYKATKIFTDIPDFITIYFLTKYTRRPLHFFGKIGTTVILVGVVILLYLSYLHYFLGQSVGTRPLLLLGALLVITGFQTVFTGLIADLVVNLNYREKNEYPLKYQTD